MKKAFKRAMRELCHDGASNPGQLLDLIRVFTKGFHEALKARKDEEGLAEYMEEILLVTDEFWLPDESWKWW